MRYQISYSKLAQVDGQIIDVEVSELVDGTFTDAMYKAHSLTNSSYTVHSVTEVSTVTTPCPHCGVIGSHSCGLLTTAQAGFYLTGPVKGERVMGERGCCEQCGKALGQWATSKLCPACRPPRHGHGVTRQARQWVALRPTAETTRTGRIAYEVILVGAPGQTKQDVFRGINWRAVGSFVVTLSVAKRSYKAAWHAWEEKRAEREQAYAEVFYGVQVKREG